VAMVAMMAMVAKGTCIISALGGHAPFYFGKPRRYLKESWPKCSYGKCATAADRV